MERKNKPAYPKDFVEDAMRLMETRDRSVPVLAEALGVNVWTLRSWWRDHNRMKRKKKVSATAPQSVEDENRLLRRELKRVERENKQLKMDREILKKAAAFFARESE